MSNFLKANIMKNHFNFLALFLVTIVWLFSCKSKTIEPDSSILFEVKTDEFIKVEIDGKQFDYRTVLKTDYQEALKMGRTANMIECADCKNSMAMVFGKKNPASTTPFSWTINIENATTNLLVDENTPIFYVAFNLSQKTDALNNRSIYRATTGKMESDWVNEPVGDMKVRIISNENGIVKGSFSGKNLDGKEIKNGSFSLRYKL